MLCRLRATVDRHDGVRVIGGEFADWRIGVCSQWAQLWVDRNFSLDYTLKSLEKILDGEPRHQARGARVVLKDAAYTVLGDMIAAAEQESVTRLPGRATVLEGRIRALLDGEIEALRESMAKTVTDVTRVLPSQHVATLEHEHGRWARNDEWRLINAADPCGT
jgi:hypothetical protein